MQTLGLETLAAELRKIKEQGYTAVAIDALIAYVEALTKSNWAADPELERQRMRAQFEAELEYYRADAELRR